MRNRNYKGRCVKQSLPKFSSVCKTYDDVQYAYAGLLAADDSIMDIKCNVFLNDDSEGEFTSDFVITKDDGTIMVRECVLLSNLLKPRMVRLLDFSQRYWLEHGVPDWKVVTNNAKE